jgi:hypothetical protein
MRRRWNRDQRGQSIVEFAMVAPVFFLLFFLIVEGGLMFNTWLSVQHSAGMGARYAVTGRDTCSSGGGGRMGCIQSEALLGMSHLSDGATAAISVQSWTFPTYAGPVTGSAGNECDAVEVRVAYDYRAKTPMMRAVFGDITLVGRQRYVNEPFRPCRA